MTSAYLDDSDSGSELSQGTDSSDLGLPVVHLCSPPKVPRLAEGADALKSPPRPPPASSAFSNLPQVMRTPGQRPTPAGHSSRFAGAVYQSPSPCKPLLERHEKALNQQRGDARKLQKLTAGLKAKIEMRSKLEEFRRKGGIMGMAKESSSSSEEGEGEQSRVQQAHARRQQHKSNQFPFPLCAPGYPVLVHTPHLITELYPPGFHQDEGGDGGPLNNLEKNIMMQQNPEVLSQLICERWFLLCYKTKPCPTAIWQWLFQVMCLSCDQYLTERVYFNLKTLTDWSRDKNNVYVPNPGTVIDVLTNLGADKDILEGRKSLEGRGLELGSSKQDHVNSPMEEDVFQSPPSSSVSVNLANLFRYVSCAVKVRHSALSDNDLRQLVGVAATVSLDCSVTKDPSTLSHISQCIASLVAAISEPYWPATLTSLSTHLVQLSPHHHNLLHLTKLITPSSPRMAKLRMSLCRASVWKLVYPDTTYRHMSDCSFAWQIVEHYYNMPAARYTYYRMYSVVSMLSHFMNLSPLQWPTQDKRKDFKSMLSKVATMKIRDIADSAERAPVKDMFIGMALEMTTQMSRQSDLYSILGN